MASDIRPRGTPGSGRPRVEHGVPVPTAEVADPSAGATLATSRDGEEPGRPTRLPTRAAYRALTVLGLAPDEACNVIAWMVGIDVAELQWSLREVNQLLFVRILADKGSFAAEADRPLAKTPELTAGVARSTRN